MRSDFSQPIDRAHSDSIKWNRYPPDVIPLRAGHGLCGAPSREAGVD